MTTKGTGDAKKREAKNQNFVGAKEHFAFKELI